VNGLKAQLAEAERQKVEAQGEAGEAIANCIEARQASQQAEVQLTEARAQALLTAGENGRLMAAWDEARAEVERLRAEQACIDIWLRRREPVTHESATLRSVQEYFERAEANLARVVEAAQDSAAYLYEAGLHKEAQSLRAILAAARDASQEGK
jgi:hypothetical protein